MLLSFIEQAGTSRNESTNSESESDQGSQKRRARIRLNQKTSNKSDKSNAFLKALELEKTTASHTTISTHTLALEGNESESTNDESRTVKKLRSRIFKKPAQDKSNNFENKPRPLS